MLAVLCRALREIQPESCIHLVGGADELIARCSAHAYCNKIRPLARISARPVRLIIYFLLALSKLPLLWRIKRSDVVIFNDIESLVSAWPIALYARSFFYLHDSHNLGGMKGRLICRIISFLTKKILVITQARVNKLADIGVVNTHYLPNCIDPDFRLINARGEWEGGEVRFVCVSQIAAWKRIDKSIEVFKRLAAVLGEYQCCLDIYGRINDGDPDKFKLRQMLSTAEDDVRVKYHGYASNVVDIFSSADVLISMSINEPFGLVLIEALHSGCYIVSAEGEGPDEIVIDDDVGIIVHEECFMGCFSDSNINHIANCILRFKSRQKADVSDFYSFSLYKSNLSEIFRHD